MVLRRAQRRLFWVPPSSSVSLLVLQNKQPQRSESKEPVRESDCVYR